MPRTRKSGEIAGRKHKQDIRATLAVGGDSFAGIAADQDPIAVLIVVRLRKERAQQHLRLAVHRLLRIVDMKNGQLCIQRVHPLSYDRNNGMARIGEVGGEYNLGCFLKHGVPFLRQNVLFLKHKAVHGHDVGDRS